MQGAVGGEGAAREESLGVTPRYVERNVRLRDTLRLHTPARSGTDALGHRLRGWQEPTRVWSRIMKRRFPWNVGRRFRELFRVLFIFATPPLENGFNKTKTGIIIKSITAFVPVLLRADTLDPSGVLARVRTRVSACGCNRECHCGFSSHICTLRLARVLKPGKRLEIHACC
jgi:hypothetical protein